VAQALPAFAGHLGFEPARHLLVRAAAAVALRPTRAVRRAEGAARFQAGFAACLEALPPGDPDGPGFLVSCVAESSLDAGARVRQGSVYTDGALAARAVADAMAAFRGRPARILDPACGGGAFLAAAALHPRASGARLLGIDRDAAAVLAARARMALLARLRSRVRVQDAFARPPEPGFDLVLGNPPYVRHEAIGGFAAKRRLATRLEGWMPGAGAAFGGRADLSVAFLLLGLSRLRPGGVLAFLLPNAWLRARYGAPLRAFLDARFEILALREWEWRAFDRAAVNPVLTLIRRPTAALRRKPRARAHVSCLFGAGSGFEVGSRAQSARDLRLVPRRSDPLAEARALAPDAFAPLGEVAALHYGTKPGLVDFFILEARDAPVEDRFLVPALTSTSEIRALEVRMVDLPRRLFVCDADPGALARGEWPAAAAHVALGGRSLTRRKALHTRAGLRYSEVPSVRGNRPWYRLRPRPGGDFALPLLIRERPLAAYTPDRIAATNMFYQGRFADPRHALPGTAILNSSLVLLALEAGGRLHIGGRINVYGPELRPLPVPDPRRLAPAALAAIAAAFAPLRRRPVGRITEEAGRADRRALDRAVLEAIGIPSRYAPLLSEALADRVHRRLRRETVRDPRDAY
jgi:SAM-dependent methyltransferase